ncbi:MAG: MBL fold metallo-hydrolase [Defluviitaleaceae bacterium]|nr:MBL fold metallo-hydrolase [Defluviitaleaceae bacterium]MCL2836025.1 MBL fold metallo-hydrolase [Defluviitaleaceae bacterium]
MNYSHWYKYGDELLAEIRDTEVFPGSIAIWFFGQAGFALKAGRVVVYIDPYFNEGKNPDGTSKRRFPPPFAPDCVDHADYVLCTHKHSDHLDPYTLTGIASASPDAKFIVPAPHRAVLIDGGIDESSIIGAFDNRAITLEKCGIIPNGCPHGVFETDEYGNHLHMGYAINMGGICVYHSGDTVEWPEMRPMLKSRGIDVILLPINGRDWERDRKGIIGNLNSRESAYIGAECADLTIPMHHDLFEGNSENPAHFVHYMHQYHKSKKYKIMVPGERFIYVK